MSGWSRSSTLGTRSEADSAATDAALARGLWPMLDTGQPAPSVLVGPQWPLARSDWFDCRLEHQVRCRPGAVAIQTDAQQWSYAELNRRAEQMAARLRAAGIEPHELVGVCHQRGPESVVALLGILKAGAAYLPLDPSWPRHRLAAMLEDARVRSVVTQDCLRDRLPAAQVVAISTDDDRSGSRRPAGSRPTIHAGNLAYAIFTSGSTGRPKAALLTHDGLGNLIRGQQEAFGVGPGTRVLQYAPTSFDASVSEIFVTLASGGTLCLATDAQLAPGPTLADTLLRMEISLVTLPPSILSLLGDVRIPFLDTLVVAGERCPAGLASQWSEGRYFINAYGPTETTVCATTFQCPEGPQPAPPIGRPLPNCRLYVLDERQRQVPIGQPGELAIGGAGVALGYLNRPELTAERFLKDALSPDPEARLYRTGDQVCLRPDGQLVFLGRRDHQVKIRGVRIELDEIARALERHESVRQAIVLDDGARPDSERLVALVVGQGDRRPERRVLQARLRRELPPVMVPSRIVAVDSLPLAATGKIDRRALLKIATGDATRSETVSVRATAARPRDGLELVLARQWESVLGHRSFGLRDDFFACGGDSLSAMDLLARLEQRLGHAVSMSQLVDHSTIEALASDLARQMSSDAWSPIVALQPHGKKTPFFCVHPGGGSALCYFELAREMGRDRAFLALQAPGFDGIRPPLETVEAMAAEYVRAIRAAQPEGPYAVGGWSFGGIVAFEIASQLHDQGERVGLLAIIDAGILYSFAVVRTLFHNDNVPLFHLSELDADELLMSFRRAGALAQLVPPGASDQMTQRILQMFKQNVEATYNYRPRPYPGKATLIEAREPFLRVRLRRDLSDEWNKLCAGGVQRHTTAGNHLTMIHGAHARDLAAQLSACLAAAELGEREA